MCCCKVGGFSLDIPDDSVGINAYALDICGLDYSRGTKIYSTKKPYFLNERLNVIPLEPRHSLYVAGVCYKGDPFSLSLDGEVVFPLDYPENLNIGETVILNMTLSGLDEARLFDELFSGGRKGADTKMEKKQGKTQRNRKSGF